MKEIEMKTCSSFIIKPEAQNKAQSNSQGRLLKSKDYHYKIKLREKIKMKIAKANRMGKERDKKKERKKDREKQKKKKKRKTTLKLQPSFDQETCRMQTCKEHKGYSLLVFPLLPLYSYISTVHSHRSL